MRIIISLLINAISIWLAAYLLKGLHIDGYITALIAGIVLAVANLIVKPILVIISLPVTILTLGLFLLIINALVLLLVAYFVPGFIIDGFVWAIIGGIVLAILNYLFSLIF